VGQNSTGAEDNGGNAGIAGCFMPGRGGDGKRDANMVMRLQIFEEERLCRKLRAGGEGLGRKESYSYMRRSRVLGVGKWRDLVDQDDGHWSASRRNRRDDILSETNQRSRLGILLQYRKELLWKGGYILKRPAGELS